jgi:cobalt/nickel transport system permease protein
MLQGTVCPVTAAVAALGLSATAYAAWKTAKKPSALSFAAVSALIFAAQMLNFPVHFGTSGHVLGAALAVALLGTPFGILSMSLAVLMQCLVFADGGVSVLGANLLNMAIIAALPAVIVRKFILKENTAAAAKATMYGVAALVSVLLASTACSVELAAAGVVPLGKVLPSMLFIHLLIGLCEGALTAALYPVFAGQIQTADNKRSWLVPFGAAILAAFVLSPFACQSPDGLEYVAGMLGFGHLSSAFFAAPFADYSVPLLSAGMFSTAAAGLIGVALMFASGYGLRRLFR